MRCCMKASVLELGPAGAESFWQDDARLTQEPSLRKNVVTKKNEDGGDYPEP
jgi:hypothetical protein